MDRETNERQAIDAAKVMVKAEAHSDDRVFEVEFDAADWLKSAGVAAIRALADGFFGGCEAADEVAVGMEASVPELGEMLGYCRRTQGRRNPVGFECNVNAEDTLRFLERERPAVYRELLESCDWR